MNWLLYSAVATSSSSCVLFVVYLYLFIIDKKRYLSFWALSWGFNSLKFILMLLEISRGEFIHLMFINQISSLLSSLFLLWGTDDFLEEPVPRWIIYTSFATAVIWSIIWFFLEKYSTLFVLNTSTIVGILYILSGMFFLRAKKIQGGAKEFVGWGFIIWGILEETYDFPQIFAWFVSFKYLSTSVISLTIALGILVIYFQKVRTDLTEIQNTLVKSEEKFRNLFNNANDPIFLYKLTHDESLGEFIEVNDAACQKFGYSRSEFLDMPMSSIYSSEDLNKKLRIKEALLELGHATDEITCLTKDGLSIPVEINSHVFTLDGKQVALSIARDITERKRAEKEIRYLSFHDKLTGLYNRAYFEEELKRLDIERQLPISLIIGDLNDLKLANDTFGHQSGDKLLKDIAKILKSCCRADDIIARWGGDEFVIVLPQSDEKVALEVCDRIIKACSVAPSNPVELSIALGASTKTQPTQDLQEILREAEDRMYKNKLTKSNSLRGSIQVPLEKTSLEDKSDYDEEYIRRLQELSLKLGQALELTNEDLDELSLLVTLHNIGKIALPSDEESKHKHPIIGYRIAQSSPHLCHIADAIIAHHERWDGNGYPQGLKGDEIPLISRILSIVDAHDSMINIKNMSQAEALDKIKKGSGTQFDPRLVRLFIKVIFQETPTSP